MKEGVSCLQLFDDLSTNLSMWARSIKELVPSPGALFDRVPLEIINPEWKNRILEMKIAKRISGIHPCIYPWKRNLK
ncbi:unnamed protein product [Wuchereria bancrofti]|uniref:Uncharacterized protein n=1 Tax=Wuchereria bancrofti TaxID=6293 RepID=A0A3P7E4M0_WUCBA|nr:unnamed protein product [Wuchereria bancrofti]